MRLFGIATLFAALAIPALAGDPVEIKLGANKGDKITKTSTFGGTGTMKITTGENEQEMACTMTENSIVAEEILEVKDGQGIKLKRYYTKKTNKFEVPDMGPARNEESSLLGKVAIVEDKDGKASTTCEGATEKDLKGEKLGDELDAALVPGKPVSVGDSWEGKPELVKKAFGKEDQEISEATLSCKLESIEEKFGQKCAKIIVKITTKGKAPDGQLQNQKISMTLEGPVWFGLKAGRTLGMVLEGKLKMSGDLPNGQGKLKMNVAIKGTGESKVGEADFSAKAEADESGEGDEGDEGDEEEEGGMK